MQSSTFTHIVVGAGSAGCVVAARIAENKDYNVLLIEAGPDCGPGDRDIPAGIQDARRVPMKGQTDVYDDRIDWNVRVELPEGGSMQVPQAKIVGGGSSINGGTALRSTETDSKEWVELGNDTWDFQSVYNVYQSIENDDDRNTCGPHPIARTRPEEAGAIQKAFLKGAEVCGFKSVWDLNAPGAEGAGPSPVCKRGNSRISAANTFIDPIRKQENLTLLTSTQVDRVSFSGKIATGVVLADGNEIGAKQGVVISAGALFSPAILQRSGIGPAALLRSLGIQPVVDLPVGLNLSDHPCIPIVAKPKNGSYTYGDYSLQMQARWSSSAWPNSTDLQMVCFSYLNAQAPDPRVQQRTLSGTATGHVAGIGCNLNKPVSRGSVRIKSKDANEAPIVAPNYLKTPYDRNAALEIVRKAFQVITSAPMQRVLHPPAGLTKNVVDSDDGLLTWILGQYSTTYHFCGSCRMASRDKGGVVDQSGRVYAVRGLWVCDASVIPTVPAANTMWTTMMFAERIGSSIRDNKDVSRLG